MLPTALDFPEDMSHSSVLALEGPGFSQGLLPPEPQRFYEIGYKSVLLNIMENIK